MSALNAFVAAASHDLFASVAAPADAAELVERDVPEGQHDARAAIRLAISNAVTARANPGPRIALILGESGSGKTHVVTTAFGYAARSDEVLPAVVQLSAPVSRDNYLSWLVEAIFREFDSRHFPDGSGRSPLKRLAQRLLGLGDDESTEALLAAIEQDDDAEAVRQASRAARKIRRSLDPRLKSGAPGEPFLAALILAGLGSFDGLHYLRRGEVRSTLADLGLDVSAASSDRLQNLADIALAAQGVGMALAIALDQVENMSRMGDEKLTAHAIRQAVRIAERIPNVAIVIAGLHDAYDQAKQHDYLASDHHRIENEDPKPVLLQKASATQNCPILPCTPASLSKHPPLLEGGLGLLRVRSSHAAGPLVGCKCLRKLTESLRFQTTLDRVPTGTMPATGMVRLGTVLHSPGPNPCRAGGR